MSSNVIALDVGDKRIGVARANTIARIAEPVTTLDATQQPIADIQRIIAEERASVVVVGLPRNMSGEETAQTAKIRAFAAQIEAACTSPVVFQDESLTSVKAEEHLSEQKKGYNKADVDALAAVYILDDYLASLNQS
jgi:putative Holliday junction resolvase